MSNIPNALLQDIAEITAGQSAPQGAEHFNDAGTPFVRAGSLDALTNGGNEDGLERIVPTTAQTHRMRLFPKDTILFAKSGMSAKLGRVYRLRRPAFVVSHLAAIITGPHLDSRYLQRWLEFRPPSRLIPNDSYPSISLAAIAQMQIPLPPLSEQTRIADILDKADTLCRNRRNARLLTQQIPVAAFHATFEEYLTADSARAVLSDVAEVVSGVAKGRNLNGAATREVPYLRVANVQAGYLDLSEIKTIPAKDSEISALSLLAGDVVMTEGGDHDKLGRGALWKHDIPECIHQNHVFRVRTDRQSLLPTFFVHYLQTSFAKGYFLRCAKKTTNLASINMTQLRALPIPLPPLLLQKQFELELSTTSSVFTRHSTAEDAANGLFDSLVLRAFRGGL